MTIAQLVASALAVCPDCHLPIEAGDQVVRDRVLGTLWHARCPSFPAAHRPAPREGIVSQLNEVNLDWR